jgi:hypothetical protein
VIKEFDSSIVRILIIITTIFIGCALKLSIDLILIINQNEKEMMRVYQLTCASVNLAPILTCFFSHRTCLKRDSEKSILVINNEKEFDQVDEYEEEELRRKLETN